MLFQNKSMSNIKKMISKYEKLIPYQDMVNEAAIRASGFINFQEVSKYQMLSKRLTGAMIQNGSRLEKVITVGATVLLTQGVQSLFDHWKVDQEIEKLKGENLRLKNELLHQKIEKGRLAAQALEARSNKK